jgi:hypothetical protein
MGINDLTPPYNEAVDQTLTPGLTIYCNARSADAHIHKDTTVNKYQGKLPIYKPYSCNTLLL